MQRSSFCRLESWVIEKHYKMAELAQLLGGISRDAIERLAAPHGPLERVKFGGQWLYPESSVQRYLDAHRQASPVVNLASRRKNPRSDRRSRRAG